MRLNLLRRKNEKPAIKVGRTFEGNVFEVVTIIFIVAMWSIAFWVWRNSPESVPTHFGLNGTPDAYGSRLVIFLIAFAGTVVSLLLLVSAYHPNRNVNMPFEISTIRQYILVIRMLRILAVVCTFLFISIILMVGWPYGKLPIGCMVASLFLLLSVTLYYTFRIYRAKE